MRSRIAARPLIHFTGCTGGAAARPWGTRLLHEAANVTASRTPAPEPQPHRWSPWIPGVRTGDRLTGQQFRVSLKFDPQRLVSYLGLSDVFEEGKRQLVPELKDLPSEAQFDDIISSLDMDLEGEWVSQPEPSLEPEPQPPWPHPPGVRWRLKTRHRDQGLRDVFDTAQERKLPCGCAFFRRRRWKTSAWDPKGPETPDGDEITKDVGIFMTQSPCAQHTKGPPSGIKWKSAIERYYLINRKSWDADVSILPYPNTADEKTTQRVQLVVDKVRAFATRKKWLPDEDDDELFSGLFGELSLKVPMDDFRTLHDAKKFSRNRMRNIVKRNRFLLVPNERGFDAEWNHYFRHSHRSHRSAREA